MMLVNASQLHHGIHRDSEYVVNRKQDMKHKRFFFFLGGGGGMEAVVISDK